MKSATVTTTQPNLCPRPVGMPAYARLLKATWTDLHGRRHQVSGTPGEFWYLGSATSIKFAAQIPAGVHIELLWEQQP